MRIAITLIRLHDEPNLKVVNGPDVPLDKQIEAIKALAHAGRENAEVAEAQVWTSSRGCIKSFKFRKPGAPASETQADETEPGDDQAAPRKAKRKAK